MTIMIGGLIVFGCIVYITITLLSFTGQSASLETQLEDVKTTLAHKKGRLEDYRIRAENLQATVPELRNKVALMQNWIAVLARQKAHLQTQSKSSGRNNPNDRDTAIQRSMAEYARKLLAARIDPRDSVGLWFWRKAWMGML